MATGGESQQEPQNPMGALFPIFMLTMLSLVLVPITLWRICNCDAQDKKKTKKLQGVSDKHSEWGKLAARQAEKLRPTMGGRLRNFCTAGNLSLVSGWMTFFLLCWAISHLSNEIAPFDPHTILGVDTGASQKEIKKAYRDMSLKYHPDKNPDPEAHKYFAEFITKAYQALTDEKSMENMAKYGNPDGPQSMQVGIALPAFMFEKGQWGPAVLAATVGIGILLPLGLAVCYLVRSAKYTGNHILQQTVHAFNYVMKPAMTMQRMMEVLCLAGEYCMMPIPHQQSAAILELMQLIRSEQDVKNDKKFLQRHPAAVKAHMLLIAQTLREGNNVPQPLQQDFNDILKAVPKLSDELMKAAIRQRPPNGYGWFRPAVGVLELCQSIIQAVPLSGRKPSEKGGGDAGVPSLLQLPHVDNDVIKMLIRKKCRGLADLLALSKADRAKVLESAEYTSGAVSDMEGFLDMVPVIRAAADFAIEEEDEDSEIMEGDIVTCNARVRLNRYGCVQKGKGAGAGPGVAPFFPFPKEEKWYALLGDPTQNALFTAQEVLLQEAEYVPGLLEETSVRTAANVSSSKPSASKKDAEKKPADESDDENAALLNTDAAEDDSQQIKLTFRAPPHGIYNLQLVLMSDYWIGCDKRVQLKLKVVKGAKMTKAEKEEEVVSDVESDYSGGEDAEALEGEEDDYDTDDYGTEESDDE
eukprot:CAMPEP_0197852036 /NCGR_PEP_ID=MMETSP1438-20131217/19509_1 /TAXON_ID=1461541 /ORGANISM="Pterosperma sp., Strain CCMP1384" /LENGTH=695 /DNA_ID=CAMNT_0043465875 /DNA_START=61 /DNA_END=2148 /DNA_ORIENTATION=-